MSGEQVDISIQITAVRKLNSGFSGEWKPYGVTEAGTVTAAKETTPTYIDPAVIEQYISGAY